MTRTAAPYVVVGGGVYLHIVRWQIREVCVYRIGEVVTTSATAGCRFLRVFFSMCSGIL